MHFWRPWATSLINPGLGHPGHPGQKAEIRSTCCLCVCLSVGECPSDAVMSLVRCFGRQEKPCSTDNHCLARGCG